MDLDEMRARFWALKDAAEAVSLPMREARDAFAREARAREEAMNAEIRIAEEGLFEMKQEMAFIARGLGGKTGERPAAADAAKAPA